VVTMKSTIFWDVKPWDSVHCLLFVGYLLGFLFNPKMKAVGSSNMSVNFHQVTHCSIPEDKFYLFSVIRIPFFS
jgi:hypothetical protein